MKKILFIIITFFSSISFVNASTDVSSFDELKTAIDNGESNIKITADISFNDVITINNNVIIDGKNKTFTRKDDYADSFISIVSGGFLEIKDAIIDGKASGWYMDYNNKFYLNGDEKSYVKVPTVSSDGDIISSNSLIKNEGDLILNNVTIQNNRSTVAGSILSGTGNNTINNSTLKHSCSLNSGGAISIQNGTTKITNTTFKDLVAGCGVTDYQGNSSSSGAIRAIPRGNLEIINSLFEDNFAQWNGGALTTYNENTIIRGTTFRHNMVGNDGSAIELISQNTSFDIDDSIFEKNIGFATNSQSLGTILCSHSVNNENTPLIFKNLIFRENEVAAGAAITDIFNKTYLNLENIEIYNNKASSGGGIYTQYSDYSIKNMNCHDNTGNGGCIYGYYDDESKVVIDNSIISNNKAKTGGGGIYTLGKELIIKNSQIVNNYATNYGGGIYAYGSLVSYNPNINIQNSIIKDNRAGKSGGGIAINDKENVFSKLVVDANSKIYNNHSDISGDDFVYARRGNPTPENMVSLNDVANVGINGIDGWYIDNQNDRFIETENPTKFEDYASNNGNTVYLKAAGINNLNYNLNGGENGKIFSVNMRYGTTYTITDEVPVLEGKTFKGWNTKIDGSGRWLHAGESYDGSDGYALYALYEPINFVNPETKNKIMSFMALVASSSLLAFLCKKYNYITL